MNRNYSGAVFGDLVELVTLGLDELEAEVREFYKVLAPMSIKASDKVKKLMVHVLKQWATRAVARFRASELDLPGALVERYVREVCTSKMILPILGNAIFPYFQKTEVDFPLVAAILQVKISDALLHLFVDRSRRTPSLPVRLSYSEVLNGGASNDAAEVDWSDVDFEEEPAVAKTEKIEIVFAGNRYFEHWGANLPGFYIKNAGVVAKAASDDPRVRDLVGVLSTVESLAL
jgi:hypothetical protein